MSDPSPPIHLPHDMYERLHRIADESNRSVEQVLLDTLARVLSDMDTLLSEQKLDEYTDEQLWGIVHHRAALTEQNRARELIAESRARKLSAAETDELDDLLRTLDRYMVLRSRTLALLHQRGYDTASLFK